MSIHSSFKSGDTMKRHRSVLSRLERIRLLQQRGVLDLETGSVFGMPKVKHLRIRVKKEKAAATAEGTAAAPGGAAAPAAAGAGAKPAAKPAAGAAKPAAGAAKPEANAPAAKKKE